MPDLNRAAWTITSGTGADLSVLKDGDLSTGVTLGYPCSIIIDLGSVQSFDTFRFVPWAFSALVPGNVEIYTCDDGATWGAAVVTATWPKQSAGWTEYLQMPRQTKRWVKFVALSGTVFLQCSEVYLQLDQTLNRKGWAAIASSQYDATHGPAAALDDYNDGWMSTFWLSGLSNGVNANFPHWIAVDMQGSETIDYVKYTPFSAGQFPITDAQSVPALARLYVSNLASPDPTDLGDWTLAGEQQWPDDRRTHWIYSTDADGNLVDRVCRHFMLVGVHNDRYNGLTNYGRMACSEIYAGKLTDGDDYKVYWKAHPQQFLILDPDLGAHGITDTLQLNLDLTDPTDLQLAKAVCEQRLWSTVPLATVYPEGRFWDWDVPAGFPGTLPVETVSRVLEGEVINATLLDPALYYKLSATGATVSITAADIENKILTNYEWSTPRWQTFYDVDVAGTETKDNFINAHPYGHLVVWGSTNQSTEPDHTVDIGRFNGTDIFYMIVWGATYVTPGGTVTNVSLTPAALTFSGSLMVTSGSGPGPGPSPCPDIPPGILPPTLAPIPLECFHLVVAHPEDGIYVTFDFTDWLPAGDAIQSATWTADVGVIITGQSFTSTTASLTANIPGAVDGEEYFAKCTVMTQLGTTEIRRVQIQVRTANFGTHQNSGWWRV
jgi:hypothetical protein